MESAESVTGVQHAASGEVLVCQVDERDINGRAGPRARSINAESAVATDRSWRPLNFLNDLSANDRNFKSLQAASPLVASSRCSMSFTETAREFHLSGV